MKIELTKSLVSEAISDLADDLLYCDRKDDDELPVGEIEKLVESGELTIREMSEVFNDRLNEVLK